ncbi:uncharacterized protein LOC109521853 [Hippocampus comes]|uniref:uncharacterized protein LOC109521853 n=1 Tax=Hippocampus comes TaxID=109280 RepID=UPI00094EDB29|nr:PREDICTED: uncharacterized protein LOC109521853 [Hippocampus comes]XP_019735487.1 PREDICTED: uncharacterized protein LOC109521853 [Hippocampus comes]XP_019735488.1 PREDICTED: uncharacterized protein LOC109521853 [Hippocampus comes]XP_019735489.1 PREDICTED: uncharacterized protein LOC109521853 [Hippocampus comes]XP_019735491.1 PREDICTED: uncharacterized protein LOC109521853 [Hippocampus comes]
MDPVAWEDAFLCQQRNLNSVYPRDIHHMGVAAPHSSHSDHRVFDGEPLEDDIDPELTRKMNVLQDIEEQILSKKAAILIKTIKMIKKKLTPDSKDATLRDRVDTILKERHSLNFLSKCKTYGSSTESDDSPSHSTEQLEEHPLKLRVEALMRHRFSDPSGFTSNKLAPNREMATISGTQPPPSHSISSEIQQENVSNKGFERFLSLLNKGVDMDLLSRVVSDNSEDFHLGEQLFNSQHSGVGDDSDRPLCCESLQCNGEPQLPENGGERTALSTSEEHPRERPSLPDDDKNGKDKRDHSLGSSSGSQSPPTVEKTKKDGKEMVQVDERCEQLQNILNTLGLSLEIEDLSKLTDRTQERLYGKKNQRELVEQQSQVTTSGSCKPDMKSTSSCSLSPSRSRSHSSSSSQLSRSREPQDPHKKDTLLACGGARKSKEKLSLSSTSQDDTQVRKTVGKNKVANILNEIPVVHSYCDPATSFAFPDDSFPHFSHYHSTYSHDINSYWTSTPDASVTPYYPSRYPDSTDTYDSHDTIPSGKRRPRFIQDVPLENPDLSTSEGQLGSVSRPRYLQVVKRKPQMWGGKRLLNGEQIKEDKTKRLNLIEEQARDVQTLRAHRATKASGKKAGRKDGSKKQRTPTEEEIKANWRKKLEAFNQMSKNKSRAQPSPCPDTQMYDVGL